MIDRRGLALLADEPGTNIGQTRKNELILHQDFRAIRLEDKKSEKNWLCC